MNPLYTFQVEVGDAHNIAVHEVKAAGYRKTKHFFVFDGLVSGKSRIKHSGKSYKSIGTARK